MDIDGNSIVDDHLYLFHELMNHHADRVSNTHSRTEEGSDALLLESVAAMYPHLTMPLSMKKRIKKDVLRYYRSLQNSLGMAGSFRSYFIRLFEPPMTLTKLATYCFGLIVLSGGVYASVAPEAFIETVSHVATSVKQAVVVETKTQEISLQHDVETESTIEVSANNASGYTETGSVEAENDIALFGTLSVNDEEEMTATTTIQDAVVGDIDADTKGVAEIGLGGNKAHGGTDADMYIDAKNNVKSTLTAIKNQSFHAVIESEDTTTGSGVVEATVIVHEVLSIPTKTTTADHADKATIAVDAVVSADTNTDGTTADLDINTEIEGDLHIYSDDTITVENTVSGVAGL